MMIKIEDLPSSVEGNADAAVAEAGQVTGGSKAKSSEKQVYLQYTLENVLISSY